MNCPRLASAGTVRLARLETARSAVSYEATSQDRSIVEAFIMQGRVVFSKVYSPARLYIPDTHVALQAWGASITADIDVYS